MNLKGIIFLIKNWKLIVHLLLGTKRFGVNNQRTSSFDSFFVSQRTLNPRKIKLNYQNVKLKATACGFLTREECSNLGWKSSVNPASKHNQMK